MPIKIPDDLPAFSALQSEGVAIMRETDAVRQDIRPLRIALLNLMPDKIRTETQMARLLGGTPLQIELSLIRITNHTSRNTSADHMSAFYRSWEDARCEKFDGLIVTGSPVEKIPYEDVTYWDELRSVFDWTRTHVHSCFYICWAAQAALYHFHGIQKRILPEKAFGVYRHHTLKPNSPYLLGFSDEVLVPVSRWTGIRSDGLASAPAIEPLLTSPETGPCLLDEPAHRRLYMFNHLEYDFDTLRDEYRRDAAKDPSTRLPHNYFPDDDPDAHPPNVWRSHAHLLFANWIHQVYQTTPYDVSAVGTQPEFVDKNNMK